MALVRLSLPENERRALMRTVRQLRNTDRTDLEPALNKISETGKEYLQANTPRGRRRRGGRVPLADAVQQTSGSRGSYSYSRVGWRFGRSNRIRRAQTLAVEHGSRGSAGRNVVQQAAEAASRSPNVNAVGDAIDQEIGKLFRRNQIRG